MERIDDLQCKGMKIVQDDMLYNFTIDPILLVNLSNVKRNATVVDLCSGSGIIPILVGAKSNANLIYGIEIQSRLCELANKSIAINGQQNLIKLINDDIKNYSNYIERGKADVVYCNPPYMKNNSTFTNLNVSRAIARQELKVTLEDCVKVGSELLKFGGFYYMVHQIKRIQEILTAFSKYNLAVKNLYIIKAKQNDKPHLVIVKGAKGGKFECDIRELVINNDDGTLTDFVKSLYNKSNI